MSGWTKIHRKLLESDIWLQEKFTRGQAWIDLILLANHKDGFYRKNGKRINVNRGQVGRSELELSARWKWSRGKTKRFIKELEKDQKIIQSIVQQNSVITICNYDKYQGCSTTDGTTDNTIDEQLTDNRQYTNKNVKNDKNEKNEKKEDIGGSIASVNGVPYQNIINLYHEVLSELPACKMLTTKRKGQIKQRWVKDMPDIENWKNYFDYVKQSPFLMGLVPPNGDRKVFHADLEWLTKESNFAKVYEGKYHG